MKHSALQSHRTNRPHKPAIPRPQEAKINRPGHPAIDASKKKYKCVEEKTKHQPRKSKPGGKSDPPVTFRFIYSSLNSSNLPKYKSAPDNTADAQKSKANAQKSNPETNKANLHRAL